MPDPVSEPRIKTDAEPALRRILAAHRAGHPPPPDRAPALERAWARSLRHAALPFDGLGLSPATVSVTADADLGTALAALPEHGILAVLEGDNGLRGLIALSQGAMDALIEVQTTGKVEPSQLPPRRVTRIDEALSRDFLDLSLAAFAREAGEIEGRDWPLRMAFGSRIEDRDRLTLLLAERTYHVLSAELALGPAGARPGQAVLVLPAAPEITGCATADGTKAAAPVPPGWAEGLRAALADAPLPLEAVLMRLTRPLGEVEALKPGNTLLFDRSDLGAVTLETGAGAVVLRGSLGQIGGRRALRVSGASSRARNATEPPVAQAADASPVSPAAGPAVPPPGPDASASGAPAPPPGPVDPAQPRLASG